MSYLLDTNVCIRIINGRSVLARQKLLSHPADEIIVCSIVRAELFYGASATHQKQRSASRRFS